MWHFSEKAREALDDEKGFTLLELLVVLVILTLLVGLAGPMVVRQFAKAKSDTARVEVQRLVTDLEFFRVDVGRFPTEEEGLTALISPPENAPGWAGPYLPNADQINDPWNNEYAYTNCGDNQKVVVSSLGADGVAGGSGENADITSDSCGGITS